MKVCISGPAASGKSFCIENYLDGRIQGLTVLSESSRKVSEMYPELPIQNIGKFREKICEFQRQRESVVENLMDNGIILCDRGIFDNLAFLLLQDKNLFHKEFTTVLNAYKNKVIKQYDYIFYFDVDLLGGITPLLDRALNDPLRKATINVDNYAKHIIEFRNAFIEVTNYFKGVKVIPVVAKPDEEGFDLRNSIVKDYILSDVNASVRLPDKNKLRYIYKGA
jgi:uncharacterized protein YkvS